MSCERKKNEISEFRINPNLYLKRLRPYAAQLPSNTAILDALTEVIAEFANLFKNSSRTVLSTNIVLGERPRDFRPSHFGRKSHHGIRFPFITSGAALNVVVIVQ
jgi:hypothetical protein